LEDVDDDAPAPKRTKRAAAAAATAADHGTVDPLQLASFPGHNMILNTSEYFNVQQVRVPKGLAGLLSLCSVLGG
jgi:hypothetical protein